MQTATRKSLQQPLNGQLHSSHQNARIPELPPSASPAIAMGIPAAHKTHVFVAADNALFRESLSRILRSSDDIVISGPEVSIPFSPELLLSSSADILLFSPSSCLHEDLSLIRKVRSLAPDIQVLLMGMSGDVGEFLQCVRSGVRGYLMRDASLEDVLDGVRALRAGEACCPGTLCALLFGYFEREACSLPSASINLRLGLTRREQQLIPLVAEGRTNKEIANHFCLSEQTVKNHLYRMKHKVGAADRLGIVQVCRSQGFLV
jgi:DNA-binding NarL/FixJ family response regulator